MRHWNGVAVVMTGLLLIAAAIVVLSVALAGSLWIDVFVGGFGHG